MAKKKAAPKVEKVVEAPVVTETEKALAPDFRKQELATNLAKVTRRSQDIH